MTIKDYFNTYYKTLKYPFSYVTRLDKTIEDFYNNCISEVYLHQSIKDNLIAWHNMLVEYTKKENTFFIRRYESGLNNNINDNRRGAKVEFDDGFSIIYASNYDAQEILNMAVNGVVPDITDFTELIKNGKYPIHFKDSPKCTESKIAFCERYKGSIESGVLTSAGWYLAHIRGVNDLEYEVENKLYSTNSQKNSNKAFCDRLFPYGSKNAIEWKGKPPVYKVSYKLEDYEKTIIKAQFLRFMDPLNYFPVPNEKNHLYEYNKGSNHYYNVGEFPLLLSYMRNKFEEIFKTIDFRQFDLETCTPTHFEKTNYKDIEINIFYVNSKEYADLKKGKKTIKKNKKTRSNNKKLVSKTAPKNSYKSLGPQSSNVRGLIGISGNKVINDENIVYCIEGINSNTSKIPSAFIKPLTSSGDAGGNKNKVFIGDPSGYTDCKLFFFEEEYAKEFLEKCTINIPSNITNLHISEKKTDSNGYFKINTEFGTAYIKASKLNE